MGLDAHAYNFIRYASARNPLGKTLTIGRQSLSLSPAVFESVVDPGTNTGGYCEPVLLALGATTVDSVDFSDYENPTYVRDLGQPVEMEQAFDTIIDAGSLEHIFDVANAFRNLISLCEVNGQIIHLLPVNNLSGHGFYQFCSDLLYTIYSPANGFSDTVCYYASSINHETWYEVPAPRPGSRTEIASLEPVILLCVTRKQRPVDRIVVTQPFYANAWSGVPDTPNSQEAPNIKYWARRILARRGRFYRALRNLHLLYGLVVGKGYSVKRGAFVAHRVADMVRENKAC